MVRDKQLLAPDSLRRVRPIRTRAGSCRKRPTSCRELRHRSPKRLGGLAIFATIDRGSATFIGIHAVRRAHQSEALEPTGAVTDQFGSFFAGEAAGCSFATITAAPI